VGSEMCIRDSPWGIPSDLHGDDSALLDDLPREFAVPFIRGYVDGNRPFIRSSDRLRNDRFTVYGTPPVLARINSMVRRHWGVSGGVVTSRQERAELRFSDPEGCRTIHSHLNTYTSRIRT